MISADTAHAFVLGFSFTVIAYFALWNTSQMLIALASARMLWHYERSRTRRARALAGRLSAPPRVSIVVPAYNEALTIVESIRALLALDYEAREIVVVNDGSKDDTLTVMRDTFHLLPAPRAYLQPLESQPVRGVYRSIAHPDLVLIDKENGRCKADAANAGINAASGALVLVIDADTVLEPDALSRAVLPFLEDPRMVAVGGYVAVANGCRIEGGRIVEVSLPRPWFARFQVIEYMRSFLMFRIACAWPNAVTLISGAFGLSRRDAVIAAGGYDTTAIGEDMDLTLRLQRHFRRTRQPFRIGFDPFPLCSTQVPEDWESMRSQRHRWRRGLLQTLWRHRGMIGNPRYGVVGLVALPYIAVFEGLGPLIEITGYGVSTVAAIIGVLDWHHYWLLVGVCLSFGAATTLFAVLLNDVATRRYMHRTDLALLVVVALLETLGYRQLNSWWGCVGTVQAMTGKGGWGVMKRRAFRAPQGA